MPARIALLCLALIAVTSCSQTPYAPPPPSRPLVGLTSAYNTTAKTPSNSCPYPYIAAIAENGGTPIILPTFTDDDLISHYIQILDALVLIGGQDIPPEAYGQEPHPTTEIMPLQRYEFESRLIDKWLSTGKPTLGICLGMQFFNVVSGGTLIQDIPSQVGTTVIHRGSNAHHTVEIDPESRLALILASNTAEVYSSHHQAVQDLGRNLKIVARSPDGVPEAAERTDGPFGLFVQWHPEYMTDLAHRDAIYGALIQACRTRR